MGALGGWGGGNLASGLQGMGTGAAANTAGTAANTAGATAQGYGVAEAAGTMGENVAAMTSTPVSQGGMQVGQAGADLTTNVAGNAAGQPTFEGMAQGLKNIGQDGAFDAFKAGMGPNTTNLQAGVTIGMPALGAYSAGMTPEPYKEEGYDPNATLNLGGDSGLRLFAMGGSTNIYGNPDGTPAQNTLNENYGLGRLNELSAASAQENAKMGGFAAGGDVGKTVNLNTRSGLSESQGGTQGAGGIFTPMGWYGRDIPERAPESNGIFTPMGWYGRDIPERKSESNGYFNPILGWVGRGKDEPAAGEYLDLDSPTGLNLARGGLADGGFVVPADVVSHLGNGSTDAGLQHLQNRMGARPIRGAGDGMSDSIKTTIEGKQPARIANGEAYIPPEVVKQRGGAKNLYAMMDKVRKERTGTKKQGKQINPSKYLPA
jgi:hypothetical protein